MDKKFSIVIPVFNGAKYIQETLDSIYNQTYKNYEIIVVDGGSTDGTIDILDLNKNQLKKIISEKDDGMYDAVNKGFSYASGDYFCYINSDDRLLSTSLEKVNAKFNIGNYDLVFGDVNYISETGKVIYSLRAMLLSKKAVKYIRRLPFAQQSSFWTKQAYQSIGRFDNSLKYVADTKFLFDIYLNPSSKVAHIPFVLGEFRMHADSFSIGSSVSMLKESKAMRDNYAGLKSNLIMKLFFELQLKIINLKDIYRKKMYNGTRLH